LLEPDPPPEPPLPASVHMQLPKPLPSDLQVFLPLQPEADWHATDSPGLHGSILFSAVELELHPSSQSGMRMAVIDQPERKKETSLHMVGDSSYGCFAAAILPFRKSAASRFRAAAALAVRF